MPYGDLETQRKYQARWVTTVRRLWVERQHCVHCRRSGLDVPLRVFTASGHRKPSWSLKGPSHPHVIVVCEACRRERVAAVREANRAARRETKTYTEQLRRDRQRAVAERKQRERQAPTKPRVGRRGKRVRQEVARQEAQAPRFRKGQRVKPTAQAKANGLNKMDPDRPATVVADSSVRRDGVERVTVRRDGNRTTGTYALCFWEPIPATPPKRPRKKYTPRAAPAERLVPKRRYVEKPTVDAEDDDAMADVVPCATHGRARATRCAGVLRYTCCGQEVAR